MEDVHDFGWAAHYAAADTPWDLGGPHPELSQRLSDGGLAPPSEGARALVPGVGRGHDALALLRRGWLVTAVDLVGELAESFGQELKRRGGRFVQGNALELELGAEGPNAIGGPFDLVWDHTFFCALHPELRAAWGARARELVAVGGRYVSLVFPTGKPVADGGPPFGMSTAAVADALGEMFELVEDRPVARPVTKRTWPERIATFQRLSARDGA
ncbi:MAG: methyltransferase domain-containing protein [Planctomycetota bacterium]